MLLVSRPANHGLSGTITPPGDKSVSHRAAILGGLASGRTSIEGFLTAEDTLATLQAMADLGADVQREGGQVQIIGCGLHAPSCDLDLGNSGTGMRLLAGALAGHPDLYGNSLRLVGDASLSRRPMGRIIQPLTAMGADISGTGDRAPLTIRPRPLKAESFELAMASAQVKSAILLAGLQAQGHTEVLEPGISRDHTERMLPAFGVSIQSGNRRVTLQGPQRLTATNIRVPADLSSAAFLIAAALLVPDSEVQLPAVGLNPSRHGFIRIVEQMAAPASVRLHTPASAGDAPVGDEPVADVTAGYTGRLNGVEIPPEWVPLAIDEFPILMAMAAVAEGETLISGASELRVKESDRLAVMCAQLQRLGVQLTETADGARIVGGAITGGRVDAEGDHRIAMSLAVLGLVARAPVEIENAEWIRTSYPAFDQHLNALGADLHWQA